MKSSVLVSLILTGGLLSVGSMATDMASAQSFSDLEYVLGRNCSRKLDYIPTPEAGGDPVALPEITFTVENGRLSEFLGEPVRSADPRFIDIGEKWSWGGDPFDFSTPINQGFVTNITCERFYNVWALEQLVQDY